MDDHGSLARSADLADPSSSTTPSLDGLLGELIHLRTAMIEGARNRLGAYAACYPDARYPPSAWNLALYLGMRRYDLRPLQARLAAHGLSSLGRSEAHILDTIERLLQLVSLATAAPPPSAETGVPTVSFQEGERRLGEQTRLIFGAPPQGRSVRIMVTLSAEAAGDYQLVRGLLERGMDCARINCAHDDRAIWQAIADNVRRAEREAGRRCRILMDLAGHKIRTGPIHPELPAVHVKPIRVFEGDPLLLAREAIVGRPPELDEADEIVSPARIACRCPAVFDSLAPGHTVWIDDGKIGAVVEELTDQGALLRITHAGPAGARIKADKGLNFPDTRLELPPLSDKDLADLDFIAGHADMVGYSFVQCLGDMTRLIDELKARDARGLPIIAKIETRRAVVNLPDILLGTLGRHPLGVMIARGDLAVELGGERMAEIQEELLWLCEAAHVPVIWATQVLENLAKKGIASRPELTDAAMGERAECVMLNKGRYILQAVTTLADILTRMEAHQYKKRAQLRALHW